MSDFQEHCSDCGKPYYRCKCNACPATNDNSYSVMSERVALRQKETRTPDDNVRLAALEAQLDEMESTRPVSGGVRLLRELKEAIDGVRQKELVEVIAQRDALLAALKNLLVITDRKHDAWLTAKAVIVQIEGRTE